MSYYPVSYGVPLAADVNRDGHVDLIFSSGTPQVTRVYLASGQGFQSTGITSKGATCPVNYACTSSNIQVADLNKDGNPDLLVLAINGPYNAMLSASLGNGNGSFRAPTAVDALDTSTNAFTTGDFNKDGLLDIATAGGSGLQIWLGNGNGTFRRGTTQTLGSVVGQLLSADLRGNGTTDLVLIAALPSLQAIGECQGGGVAVLLGNGDGTFPANATYYSAGEHTYGAVIADMNGDHKPDIVAANRLGASYSVLLNAGAGKFATATNYRSPEPVDGNFVTGDLNGDGKLDLTISSQTGIEVLRNASSGHLFAPTSIDLLEGATPTQTYAADMHRVGYPDLVGFAGWDFGNCHTSHPDQLEYDVVSQVGKPLSFVADIPLPSRQLWDIGIGDFYHDGQLEILALGDNFAGETYLTIQRIGSTPYPPAFILEGIFTSGAVGDFNRDGYADIALTNGSATQIVLNHGAANFSLGKTYSPGPGPIVARDINADGRLDLISGHGDGVQVLLGDGDGTFQTPKLYATVQGPNSIAVADFNRDGKPDLAVGGGSQVSMLLNNGSGTFKSAVNYSAGGPVTAIAAISLAGNGNQSVLIAGNKDDKLFLLAGSGTGTLAAPVNYYPGGGKPRGLTVADFNSDGASDVAAWETTTSSYMILYNTGGTSIKLTSSNAKPIAGQSVTFTATLSASIAGSGTPSGTVTFKNGSATLGTVTLSGGKAVFSTASLARGAHAITATYNGSGTFNSHVSPGLTVTVQ